MIDIKERASIAAMRAYGLKEEGIGNALAECRKRIAALEACLSDTREEICEGPVDDVLWHAAVPACTTVDNITLALNDGWTYDGWLQAKEEQTE